MLAITALRKQKRENHEFKVSLSFIARPCLKKKKKTKQYSKNGYALLH
jgi:hypothetical protein